MVHKIEKKDISITGEEIFLPTDPNEIGGNERTAESNVESNDITSLKTTVDYEPLPTKPEDIN